MLQLEIGEGNLNAPSYGYVGPKVGDLLEIRLVSHLISRKHIPPK